MLSGFWWLFFKPQKPNPLRYIPVNALAIVEIENPVNAWQRFVASPGWYFLREIPCFKNLGTGFMAVKMPLKNLTDLSRISNGKTLYLSLHQTASRQTDALFTMVMSSDSEAHLLGKLANGFQATGRYLYSRRNYNGFTIEEFKEPKTNTIFSYVVGNGLFAGSFTPFLVEDLIRNLKVKHWPWEADQQSLSNQQLQMPGMQGIRLMVNLRNTGNYYAGYFSGSNQLPGLLATMGNTANLNYQSSANLLALQGTVMANDSDGLGLFQNQVPQPFRIAALVPNNTALMLRTSFSDPDKFFNRFLERRISNPGDLLNLRYSSKTDMAEDIKAILGKLELEYAYCELENLGNPIEEKLLVLPCKNSAAVLKQLQKLADGTAYDQAVGLYNDKVNGFKVQQLKMPEVPALLLGNAYAGFENCFALCLPKALVISNSAPTLKRYLEYLANDEVWSGTFYKVPLLNQKSKPSNLMLVINANRIWNRLTETADKVLLNQLLPWHAQNKQLPFFTLQMAFNQTGSGFETSVAFCGPPVKKTEAEPAENEILYDIELPSIVNSAPKVIRNPFNKTLEVLLTDSGKGVLLLNKDGAKSFRIVTKSPPCSDFYPVDLEANGGTRYFFATGNRLNVYDRKGDSLAPFPIKLPQRIKPINALPVDYENDGQYRFLIADRDSGLFLMNRNGQLLEGWSPRFLASPVVGAMQYLRIGNRDCFLVAERDGLIHLFNRRGQELQGFPIELGTRISNSLFVAEGIALANSSFEVLTDDGQLMSFNFQGKKLGQNQLYRPSRNAVFRLCPEPGGNTFVIACRDADTISLFGRNLKHLFTKRIGRKNSFWYQYYHFGAGNEVFALTVPENGKTTLYNNAGKVIKPSPFESSRKIALLYSEASNTCTLYRVINKRVIAQRFGLVAR